RIERFNPAAERTFGYVAAEVIGERIDMLMPEPYHSEHAGYLRAYHETGRRRIIGIGREVVGRRKSGETFPMDLAVNDVRLPEGRQIFVGVVRDITERRQLERAVLHATEEERRRIGQDLHDGLGQMLTATGLRARRLAKRLAADESLQTPLADELVTLLDEADSYARALARGLVPVDIETGGLADALDRLAERASRLLGIDCQVSRLGVDPPLGPEAAIHLYRIAQEAVSNAARHGRASRVTLALAGGERQSRLRVEDDGIGFAASEAGAAPDLPAPVRPRDDRGMGVRIMHYRARVAGGELDIRPGPDGGTVVTCTIRHDAPQTPPTP
ncbi:MAG: PAS domain-containing sensor histidine kinase, partial [Bacteroidota bacterium]